MYKKVPWNKGLKGFQVGEINGMFGKPAAKGSGTGKGGKRVDLNNQYFRSRWEPNYARILNLKGIPWLYESKVFYLRNDKGKIVDSYRPDFYLPETDEYIEIKGWLSPEFKKKWKLFKEQYPDIKITLIGPEEYSELEKKYKGKIKEWE